MSVGDLVEGVETIHITLLHYLRVDLNIVDKCFGVVLSCFMSN
jgi:hypothetical protein